MLTRGCGATLARVLLGACGGGHRAPGAAQPQGRLVAALCEAAGRAGAGDPGAARKVFFDRAHQPIHELASANFATPNR